MQRLLQPIDQMNTNMKNADNRNTSAGNWNNRALWGAQKALRSRKLHLVRVKKLKIETFFN